eukprot:1158814-Pelagomonas_calceolata.AAC.1
MHAHILRAVVCEAPLSKHELSVAPVTCPDLKPSFAFCPFLPGAPHSAHGSSCFPKDPSGWC